MEYKLKEVIIIYDENISKKRIQFKENINK